MNTQTETWTSVQSELPDPNMLVWVKRKNGSIYLGYRMNRPLSINLDPSRDCHWHGNQIDNHYEMKYGKYEFHNMFSDVTVEAWTPALPPK